MGDGRTGGRFRRSQVDVRGARGRQRRQPHGPVRGRQGVRPLGRGPRRARKPPGRRRLDPGAHLIHRGRLDHDAGGLRRGPGSRYGRHRGLPRGPGRRGRLLARERRVRRLRLAAAPHARGGHGVRHDALAGGPVRRGFRGRGGRGEGRRLSAGAPGGRDRRLAGHASRLQRAGHRRAQGRGRRRLRRRRRAGDCDFLRGRHGRTGGLVLFAAGYE
mmetsp:Transcript_17058/g.50897  ORF Transcript_17058/g.50897 Transcript_17058/m.50897 type:complete len:216 (-) Transcript_17058:204-851(-)